jgi:transposase
MMIRDDQWEKLEPLLLGRKGNPGVSGRNNRLFIEAVLLHVFGNCYWSALPPEFGEWNAIYMRFRRWNQSGYWRQLVIDLVGEEELCAALERVARYADQQTEDAVRRKNRRAERQIYPASVTQFGKSVEKKDSKADVSWLSLVEAN